MLKVMNNQNILKAKLQVIYPSLPRTEKIAAAYLIEHFQRIGELGLNVISAETGASNATIIRLCRRLGFKGFLDFRNSAKHPLSNTPNISAGENLPTPPLRNVMETVIQQNINTMQNTLALSSTQYESAANAIQNARNIIMFGNGDAIIPCNLIGIKLMKIGKACSMYNDQDLQMFCATAVQKGDVALAVSHTGRSRSVVESMRIASEKGAVTIGITASQKSPLLKYCDHVLFTGTIDNTIAGDIISRRIAEQLVLETLYHLAIKDTNEVLEAKKQGAEVILKMTKLHNDDSDSDNSENNDSKIELEDSV